LGFVSAASAAAQSSATNTADFGAVVGHVYLADGNLPARLSHVALQPVSGTGDSGGRGAHMEIYQTGLDGSFRMEHVPSGDYYVVVTRPGYPRVIEQFTAAELAKPTPDIQKQLDTMPRVTVRTGATASIDVTIVRGASIEGHVRFEDGEPYPEACLTLQYRNADRQWESVRGPAVIDCKATDDNGAFHLYGLPAGEYLVSVDLSTVKRFQDQLTGGGGNSWSQFMSRISLYSGNTPHLSAAKPIKLVGGEQAGGQDIVIPLSKLHTIEGAVVDERTGQALNAGYVELLYADDHAVAAAAAIDPETRSFTVNFAPEGNLLARVSHPHEGVPGTSEHDKNSPLPNLDTVVRSYDPAEIPLEVHGDMSGLTLAVKERVKRTK